MYPLFEWACLLSLQPKGDGRRPDKQQPRIEAAAWKENGERNILALAISNGNLLLRYSTCDRVKPVIHQLPWLQSPTQHIVSLCFDPSGTWLLCVAVDSTLYIVPVLAILDATAKMDHIWCLDNVTKIEMNGKRGVPPPTPLSRSATSSERAHPTCITWWTTFDHQHIAIIGNELGEICFINLVTKKEVGGTYITLAIKLLELVQDDLQDMVYLLITGSNGFQWQLLLEQISSGYQWPLEHDSETADRQNKEPSGDVRKTSALMTVSSSSDISVSSSVELRPDHQPQRLSKFAGHTHLFPQYVKGRHFMAGYYSPTSILSIHSTDLNVVPLFVYKLPAGCDHIVITDRLTFVLSKSKRCLSVISSQLSESTIDGKKEFNSEAELQNFPLPVEDVILTCKRSGSHFCFRKNNTSRLLPRSAPSSPRYNTRVRRPSGSLGLALASGTGVKRSALPAMKEEICLDDIKVPSLTTLDGCLVILETSVFECRPRMSPEHLFLELVLIHQDLRASEKLSISLALDLNRLYEAAADNKLSQGQFASAVRLYQLSKCPHVRSVANFAAHGCIAELLSYVRVLLFNHGQVEFSLSDRRHFANMELLCYVHQSLELKAGPMVLFHAFKQFLKDNHHYCELLAVQLLSEHGLLDLLLWLALRRGLLFAMAEELLQPQSPSWLDASTATSFRDRGFGALLHGKDNASFMQCLTEPRLAVYLVIHPQLLQKHSHFIMQILNVATLPFLHRAALLYDPCHYAIRFFLLRSLSRFQKSTVDFRSPHTLKNENNSHPFQILIETFLAILLMLNANRGITPFNLSFLNSEMKHHINPLISAEKEFSEPLSRRARLPQRSSPISCGLAHAALIRNGDVYTWGRSEKCCLGHGHLQQECLPPLQLQVFVHLNIKVIAVACGAYHCLVLTNHGVYAWGSSNYGQVGTGRIDKEPHPVPVERLGNERIVSIACGQYHSMALTDDGRVFTWGWGVHGQLGHGNPNDCVYPCQIESLLGEVVVRVSAGYGHSAVLTAKGDVYTFGCGLFGQLGLGSLNKYSTPQHVELPEKINLLSCGYFHNVVVSASSKLYTWGSNPQLLRIQAQASRKARIQAHMKQKSNTEVDEDNPEAECTAANGGKTSESSDHLKGLQSHLTPSLLENNITAPITQVACGSHHSAVITVDGEAFTWGRNLDGQLGNGTRKEQKTPGPVIGLSSQKITHISCGHDFTIAVDVDGRVWGWGHNDCGQIGLEPEASPACAKTIMIKTNKRVVQLRNTAQWGIVQPQEMIGLAAPLSAFEYHPTFEVDDVLNDENSLMKEKALLLKSLNSLSHSEDPPFACKTLHLAIELFSSFYNPHHIVTWSLKCKNFQLAAKVSLLQQEITQSFAYQLQALHQLSVGASNTTIVIATVEFYLKLISDEDVDNMKILLHHVLSFWVKERLPISALEEFLLARLDQLLHPLSILLICNDELSQTRDIDLASYVLSHMSTKFCLALASALVTQVNSGIICNEFLQLFSNVGQQEKTASLELKDFLINGVNCLHSITISSCGLESLLCSLDRENSSPTTTEISGSSEIVAFSCGHHFTSHTFYSVILPKFEDSMRMHLPCSLSRTSQAILASYKTDGLLPMSCPNCVLDGIRDHL